MVQPTSFSCPEDNQVAGGLWQKFSRQYGFRRRTWSAVAFNSVQYESAL